MIRSIASHHLTIKPHALSKKTIQSSWQLLNKFSANAADSNTVDEWCVPVKLRKPNRIAYTSGTSFTDEALIRLHRHCALNPPNEGSSDLENVKLSLQSMLAMVDSVKDFQPVDEFKSSDISQIPDGRIWPADESLPIDWESLIQTQKEFIQSRKHRIPGRMTSEPSNENKFNDINSSDLKSISEESKLVSSMAIEGVHVTHRKGIGQKPNSTNAYYAAKRSAIKIG